MDYKKKSMRGPLFEPTLYMVKGMCILDNEGNRILSKYYDPDVLPTNKEQKAFEKNLFNRAHRSNADIIILDGLTCVYKRKVDLYFYVMGSSHENELILQSVLNALYKSVYILLRRNVEKRILLDNLDAAMLVLDEICDGGIILDSNPISIVSRVVKDAALAQVMDHLNNLLVVRAVVLKVTQDKSFHIASVTYCDKSEVDFS